MKIIYRGECEELYGQEIDVPDHKCSEYITHKVKDFADSHGLDGPPERWTEEWWECAVCKEHYTDTEAAQLFVDAEAKK